MLATLENIPEHPQRMVRFAVQGVALGNGDQPGGRRALVALHVVVVTDAVVAFGNNLLHVAQALLGLGRQRILGIFLEESLKFLLGGLGFAAIAIRLGHFLVVCVRYLELRVGRFRQEWEENTKVLVRLDRLRQARRTALSVVGIRNRQLRFSEIFAVRIGVDQRLEAQAPDFLAPVLDVIDSPVVQNLIRFGRVVGAGGLIDFLFFMEDLSAAGADRQRHYSACQNKNA